MIAKSPALYRARITNSIALLVLGIVFAVTYHYGGLVVLGSLIQMLTFIILTICIFIGVQLTSDSIAREKREGTIGLLFLTHLSSFQIVLGKLIAHGLMGFYWLMIAVPLLSLMLVVGGLDGASLAYVALAAMNILFFSCAVGLFVSARSVDRKKAAGYGTWIVLFFWWGLPLLVGLATHYKLPEWVVTTLGLFSVSGIYNSPFTGPRVPVVQSSWLNLFCIHLLGWLFVWAASVSLRERWQDQPPKAKFNLREWWRRISLGSPATRVQLRRKLLDRNPFLWLACRERLRGLSVWIATIIILAFLVYTAIAAGGMLGLVLSFGAGLCVLHKVMMGTASAYQLQIEQEQGTLEMLTSTPLHVDDIVKGQLLASKRLFRGPVLGVLLMHLVVAVSMLFTGPPSAIAGMMQRGANLLMIAAVLVNGGMYVFDLYAMAWAGMWGAVSVRDPRNSAGFAMVRIILMPAVLFGWLAMMRGLADWYLGIRVNVPVPAIVALWFTLCAMNNAAWLIVIRRKLPDGIRTFALRPYSPDQRRTVFSVLGRWWGRTFFSRSRQSPVIRSMAGPV